MHYKKVEPGGQDAMLWGPDVHHGAWGGMVAKRIFLVGGSISLFSLHKIINNYDWT
jgi:uncharacterized iron-regulated membrane protein